MNQTQPPPCTTATAQLTATVDPLTYHTTTVYDAADPAIATVDALAQALCPRWAPSGGNEVRWLGLLRPGPHRHLGPAGWSDAGRCKLCDRSAVKRR